MQRKRMVLCEDEITKLSRGEKMVLAKMLRRRRRQTMQPKDLRN
jgi:hypothetical protein